MISAISSPNTNDEILDALNVKDISKLKSNVSLMYRTLNEIDDDLKTILDNTIWLNEGFEIYDETAKDLAENYYLSSYKLDFKDDNKKSNKTINDYINEKTNGLINPNLEFDQFVDFIIMNILYYKDVWNILGEFLPYFDKEIEFSDTNNKISKKQFLEGHYEEWQVYKTEEIESFYISTGRGYKLNFIKPTKDYTIDEVFNSENIKQVMKLSSFNTIDEESNIKYLTRCIFLNLAPILKRL